MRILFAGTPSVAIPALRELHASNHEIVGVLTRPPAPVGRKRVMTPSPIHAEADELGLPVWTDSPDSSAIQELLSTLDCVAVVAYGNLIKEPSLSLPKFGWVNLHFSRLPKWRGAAPVQHALMAGEDTTAVSVFQIEAGLDTGPVFDVVEFDIYPDETAGALLDRLAQAGAPILSSTLDAIESGRATAVPQTGEVTLAPTLRSAHAQINWHTPAADIANRIRGFTPAPGAWTTCNGQRYKIGPVKVEHGDNPSPGVVAIKSGQVLVGTKDHPVALTTLAPPGKKWMSAADWARGLQGEEIIFESNT